MGFNIEKIDNDLDFIFCKKEKISPAVAVKWKWRVLNEYPDELKQLVRAWATDQELPEVFCNGISFKRIIDSTPLGFLDSIDLLYILQKDPANGYDVFLKSVIRDGDRRL